MAGYNVNALSPSKQVEELIRSLVARVRSLEAAAAVAPLVVVPAAPLSTSSPTSAPLWSALPPGRADAAVTITVVAVRSSNTATASVTLSDADGHVLTQSPVISQQPIVLTAPGPAPGPFTISGAVSTGSLAVTVVAASAPRYIANDVT